MPNPLPRPAHLPDFTSPPLNEVVVGVQFSPPKNYQQILAGEVWELFKKQYPKVQEMPPLQPAFETFGLPGQGRTAPQIRFESGPMHNRFWFLSENGEELIQFQRDRLLHNWRKSPELGNEYPRFESMIQKFEDELAKLNQYCKLISSELLQINQVEISYINHIEPSPGLNVAGGVFNFLKLTGNPPEDFSISLRDVLPGTDGQPVGRLFCEITSGRLPTGKKVYVMNLTVRGKPSDVTADAALSFIKMGRKVISKKFVELTSDAAHKLWGRTQ